MPAALLAALALATAPPALPFAPEERMDFTVTYLGLKVGTARIAVGRPIDSLLPVFLQARTGGIASIADVREALVSNLDVATLLPRLATLDAVEPGYRHSDRTHFDREAGKATFTSRGKSESTEVVDIPPGTIDFVALIFRLRTLPLPDGARHEFPVLAGSKVSQVVAQVEGRERVETGAGTFPAVRVRIPTGFTGKFSERNPTYVWFSDDARRIVVRIGTDFVIGRAVASLVSYAPGLPPAPPAQGATAAPPASGTAGR